MADRARYLRWRTTIPFTDEECAQAMEEAATSLNEFLNARYRHRAGQIRRGYLAGRDLGIILPILIKTCNLCGKKALYRTGVEGRCRDHRHSKSLTARERVKRLEAGAAVLNRDRVEFDTYDARGRSLRLTFPSKHRRK